MADVRTMKLNLLADVAQFGRGLGKAEKDTKQFSGSVSKYSKAMAKSFALAGVAAAAFAVKIGVDSIKAASDLSEEISKIGVIFGDASKEINAFAETAADSLGLSKKEALSASGTFAILGKNAGLSGKELTKFSKTSVTLAADLGSFYNTKAEDAIAAIGSAMRGEAEPIRKYGVLISAASLDQAALNYENRTGEVLERDKKNQLTETSKVLARYQAILDQTKDAQGDFNRTSGGLAAQQKILSATFENLKTDIGTGLLPVMTQLVQRANKVAKAFSGKDPDGLSTRARELKGEVGDGGEGSLGRSLAILAKSFGDLFSALAGDSTDAASTNLENFATALNNVAKGINALANAYRKAKSLGGRLLDLIHIDEGEGPKLADSRFGKAIGYTNRAAGGSVMGNQAYRVGEFGPEMFVPSGSGSIRKASGNGDGVTIIMNGVIDGESARRSIERLLQNSARRTGAINLVGATL